MAIYEVTLRTGIKWECQIEADDASVNGAGALLFWRKPPKGWKGGDLRGEPVRGFAPGEWLDFCELPAESVSEPDAEAVVDEVSIGGWVSSVKVTMVDKPR